MDNLTNNIGSEIAKISEGLKETMEAFKKSTDARLESSKGRNQRKEQALKLKKHEKTTNKEPQKEIKLKRPIEKEMKASSPVGASPAPSTPAPPAPPAPAPPAPPATNNQTPSSPTVATPLPGGLLLPDDPISLGDPS